MEPTIQLTLDHPRGMYLPGDTLAAVYQFDRLQQVEPKAVELSVLWYTEGKGDEDLAVHFFERQAADDGTLLDVRRPRRFTTVLPESPLSYEGIIIKIHWCVRVRLFLPRGKVLLAEEPFRLGNVPDVRLTLP